MIRTAVRSQSQLLFRKSYKLRWKFRPGRAQRIGMYRPGCPDQPEQIVKPAREEARLA